MREISKDILNLNYSLTVIEILLGILCAKNTPCHILNLLILVVKQYINSSRRKEQQVSLKYFYRMTQKVIETEIYLMNIQHKDNSEFLDVCKQILRVCE